MADPSTAPPPPNFTSSYSVVLPYPLDQVFSNLATANSVERVARLSSFVTAFSLGDTEPISISSGALSSTRGGSTLQLPASASADSLPRTKFTMDETIPVLGGIFKPRVAIEGSQTEDAEGRCCLYESAAQKNGITIWKLRSFEEVDGADGAKATKVSERIEGWCPGWMRLFVERNCRHAHKAHMDMFHKLLDGSIE